MSIFYNNYQKLVSENDSELAQLSEQAWNTMDRMMKYMKSFQISLFEVEVIKKDLIGMAAEAQMEGIEFQDKLGMPEKEFCDRLVENADRRGLAEQFMPVARNFAVSLFGTYVFTWGMRGMPGQFGITNVLLIFACIAAVLSLLDGWLRERNIYREKRKRQIVWTLYVIANYMYNRFIIEVMRQESDLPRILMEKFLIRGSGAANFFVLLVTALALYLLNNYFWDRHSEKYEWK